MNHYTPPIDDIIFVLDNVLNCSALWSEIPDFEDIDIELAREVLTQSGKFAQDVLAPLNSSGDLEGCQWSPGTHSVKTPTGFAKAWAQFVEGGWPSLACDPALGGQGLPQLLNAAVFEMLATANDSWVMYSGVQHGAYESLSTFGSDELKARFLDKIVCGEWLSTMALTEPQAGSDLSLLRCKAEFASEHQTGNGAEVKITGQKIFISGGEHDLTDNILHLVLARLPGAPEGTRGLSLALVPKIVPDTQQANEVFCDGIEKKMGLKGSATCQMRFEGATGWLIGEPHTGLKAMFLMMNAARIHVGVKCVGHLEGARQKATHYALDRQQFKAPSAPTEKPRGQADPIAYHPAIRHKLLRLNAMTQAARVVAFWAVSLLDVSEHSSDKDPKTRANSLVSLLTPIVKGFTSDMAFFGCDEALGVFGGYGYIHEYGIEQQVRDVRVTRLYEGSNEIQAIDLLCRKMLGKTDSVSILMKEFNTCITRCQSLITDDASELNNESKALLTLASQKLSEHHDVIKSSVHMLRNANSEPLLYSIADDVLQAMGYSLYTWAWTKIALASTEVENATFAQQQQQLSRYGLEWLSDKGISHWQVLSDPQKTLPFLLQQ